MKTVLKILVPVLMVAGLIFIYNVNNLKDGIDPELRDFYDDYPDIEELKKENKPIIITAYLPNCPACERIKPELINYRAEYKDEVIFKYVNIAENPDFRRDFPVRLTPTTFFFDANNDPLVIESFESPQIREIIDRQTNELRLTAYEGYFGPDIFNLLIKELLA